MFRFGCITLLALLPAAIVIAAEPAVVAAPGADGVFRGGAGDSMRKAAVAGQPFREAFRLTVGAAGTNPWDAQLGIPTAAPIRRGDGGTLEFFARKLSGGGRIAVAVERASEPYSKFVNRTFTLTPEWKRYCVVWQNKPGWEPGTPKEVYAPGEARVIFNASFGPQQLEVAGVRMLNYGRDAELTGFEVTRIDYPGRAADAPWRAEAEKRIEKLRKGDFRLELRDASGDPLPAGTPVKVELAKHAFSFGSCINRGRLLSSGPDADRYRREFAQLFNEAVFEGAMKWGQGWEYDDSLQKCLKYLKDNDIAVRGHTLVWPGWNNLPRWLPALKHDRTALRQTVRDHVFYVASRLKDEVTEFDVVNESVANHDLQDLLGEAVMAEWFRAARQAAPAMRLYINEYDILSVGDNLEHRQLRRFAEILDRLKAQGAPLGGIGMQSHFGEGNLTSPENLLKILDRFARYGVPLKITEYDFKTLDEQLEADYLRDIMTVIFSHPAGAGFVMWGFWNGNQWKLAAPVYREDWSEKPSGRVYRELVFGRWHTALDGKTERDGRFSGRGFYGAYRVTATAGGRELAGTFRLEPGREAIDVTLK